MSYSYRFIILFCLLFSSSAFAVEFFADALYWRATETVDWVLTNNLNAANQVVGYETTTFDFEPGFRLGAARLADWDSKIYYTRFYSKATGAANGNLTSTFLGGKLVQSTAPSFFYHSGQVSLSINYNVIDLDLSKRCYPSQALMLRPIIGLRGGIINQTVTTTFQGNTSVTEIVKNNFKGIGPKAGIETIWSLTRNSSYHLGIFSEFSASYLWGTWNISDAANDNHGTTFYTNVGRRNLGAFTLQGILGLNLDYKCFAMKLGYEIADWFDQYQVLDDGTGAHNNDLILQGITLRIAYNF